MSYGSIPADLDHWMSERLGQGWEIAWRLNDVATFYSLYLELDEDQTDFVDGLIFLTARLCEGEWAFPQGAIPDRVFWTGKVTRPFAQRLESIIPLRWYRMIDGRICWRRPSWAGASL